MRVADHVRCSEGTRKLIGGGGLEVFLLRFLLRISIECV